MSTLALLFALSLPAAASEAPGVALASQAVPDGPAGGKRPPPSPPKKKKPKKPGADKAAANKKSRKNYKIGQAIAAGGVTVGAAGVVVLAGGWSWNGGWGARDNASLHTAAGLLSVGGLVGSSGALGAGIAVDNATKKPAPVIAGALGLTLGIFAPTFFGVGVGLDSPAFAWASIGTGATSTALAALQMAQSTAHRPKRWTAWVDPMSGRVQVAFAL